MTYSWTYENRSIVIYQADTTCWGRPPALLEMWCPQHQKARKLEPRTYSCWAVLQFFTWEANCAKNNQSEKETERASGEGVPRGSWARLELRARWAALDNSLRYREKQGTTQENNKLWKELSLFEFQKKKLFLNHIRLYSAFWLDRPASSLLTAVLLLLPRCCLWALVIRASWC